MGFFYVASSFKEFSTVTLFVFKARNHHVTHGTLKIGIVFFTRIRAFSIRTTDCPATVFYKILSNYSKWVSNLNNCVPIFVFLSFQC